MRDAIKFRVVTKIWRGTSLKFVTARGHIPPQGTVMIKQLKTIRKYICIFNSVKGPHKKRARKKKGGRKHNEHEDRFTDLHSTQVY